MRIVPTAIIIAVGAMSTGCGGNSSSSSGAPAQESGQTTSARTATTVAQMTRARTKTTPAQTSPARAKANAPRANKTSGSGPGAKTGQIHLVGRSLAGAETVLNKAGISYNVIPLHGHNQDAVAHWGVCETTPAAGSSEGAPRVDLLVGHFKCGAG
jgi:hypothetical protein